MVGLLLDSMLDDSKLSLLVWDSWLGLLPLTFSEVDPNG